ncbi:MAG: hypothetical protein ACREEW_10460 [Caulobacteraceae bacterium]
MSTHAKDPSGRFGSRVKSRLALAASLALLASAARALPATAVWRGDICRAAGLQCLKYPRRVEYHEPNCRWVGQSEGAAVRQFEVCRDPRGVWRPSGRS